MPHFMSISRLPICTIPVPVRTYVSTYRTQVTFTRLCVVSWRHTVRSAACCVRDSRSIVAIPITDLQQQQQQQQRMQFRNYQIMNCECLIDSNDQQVRSGPWNMPATFLQNNFNSRQVPSYLLWNFNDGRRTAWFKTIQLTWPAQARYWLSLVSWERKL